MQEGVSGRQLEWAQIANGVGAGIVATQNSNSELIFGRHVQIQKIVFTIMTALTVTKPVISVYRRPVAGSATNQVKIGTMTLNLGAAGTAQYQYIGSQLPAQTTGTDGSLDNAAPSSNVSCDITPGGSLFMNVDTAASAGSCAVSVQYDSNDIYKGDTGVTELTAA